MLGITFCLSLKLPEVDRRTFQSYALLQFLVCVSSFDSDVSSII